MVQGLSLVSPALTCAEACSDLRAVQRRAHQKPFPQDQQQRAARVLCKRAEQHLARRRIQLGERIVEDDDRAVFRTDAVGKLLLRGRGMAGVAKQLNERRHAIDAVASDGRVRAVELAFASCQADHRRRHGHDQIGGRWKASNRMKRGCYLVSHGGWAPETAVENSPRRPQTS